MPDPPEIHQLTLLSTNVIRILTGASHVYHVTDAGIDIHARSDLTRTGYAAMTGITCAALNGNGLYLGTASGVYRLPLSAVSGDVAAQLALAFSTGTTPALGGDGIRDIDGRGTALLVAHEAGADYLPDSAAATLYRCAVEGGVQRCACGAERIALSTPYRVAEMEIPAADFAAPGWEKSLGRVSLSDDFHAASPWQYSQNAMPDPGLWIPDYNDDYAELRIINNALNVPAIEPRTGTQLSHQNSLYRFTGDFSVELAFEDLTGEQAGGTTPTKGLGLAVSNEATNESSYKIIAGFTNDTQSTNTPCWWFHTMVSGSGSTWSRRARSGAAGRIRVTRAGTQVALEVRDETTAEWSQLGTYTESSARSHYVNPFARHYGSPISGRITSLVITGESSRTPPLVTPRALRYDAAGRLAFAAAERLQILAGHDAVSGISGLVAEYSGAGLDPDTWTITPDRGDTSLVATFTGLTAATPGRLGTAIDLVGNGCITVPQAAIPRGEFTFCCWINGYGRQEYEYLGAPILRCNSFAEYTTITGSTEELFTYISKHRVSNRNFDSLQVALYNANRRDRIIYDANVAARGKNGWNLVAVSYSGGQYNINTKVWYNGEQCPCDGRANTNFQGATTDILIGGSLPANGRYLVGKIEKIRFYNRALTQQEITALYNEPEPGADPVTLRYQSHLAAVNDAASDARTLAWVNAAQYETQDPDGVTTLIEHGGNVAGLDQQYYHGFVDDSWFQLPATAIVQWLPPLRVLLSTPRIGPPPIVQILQTLRLALRPRDPLGKIHLLYRPHRRIWRLTLDDAIQLPMSSFQLRLRESDNSYLSAVIPNAPAYAGVVAAHPGAMLKIWQGYLYEDGEEDLVLIAQAKLQTVADSRGPNSQSLTLTGYGKAPAAGPAVETDSVSYTRVSEGVTRWRCEPTPQLAPGGILINRATGEQLRAALITWYVSINNGIPQAQMEVATDGNG